MQGMKRAAALGVRNALRRRGVEIVRPGGNLLGMHLAQTFDRLGVDLVLDVGARVGDYGTFLRENGYRGRIVSFEPVASNVAELKRRASGDAAWRVVPVALGDEESTARINVTEGSEFSSFLHPSATATRVYERAVVAGGEDVPVRRLDGMWADVVADAKTVFLKVDTQGWDLHVLRGAGERLSSVAAVQTEVSLVPLYDAAPSIAESLAALAGFGFAPTGLFPAAFDVTGRLFEMDCVCVRA